MSEDYTFAEGYTCIQICELWDCCPQDIIFMPEHGATKAHWQHVETLEFVEADLGSSQITVIDATDDGTVWGCNNCGSSSLEGADQIKHHPGCKPGEAEFWAHFYSEEGEGGEITYD